MLGHLEDFFYYFFGKVENVACLVRKLRLYVVYLIKMSVIVFKLFCLGMMIILLKLFCLGIMHLGIGFV